MKTKSWLKLTIIDYLTFPTFLFNILNLIFHILQNWNIWNQKSYLLFIIYNKINFYIEYEIYIIRQLKAEISMINKSNFWNE